MAIGDIWGALARPNAVKAYKNGNAQNYIVELIPPSFPRSARCGRAKKTAAKERASQSRLSITNAPHFPEVVVQRDPVGPAGGPKGELAA